MTEPNTVNELLEVSSLSALLMVSMANAAHMTLDPQDGWSVDLFQKTTVPRDEVYRPLTEPRGRIVLAIRVEGPHDVTYADVECSGSNVPTP
mmetsp:Transcript_62514/g.135841  ORF Transcript_62514/g.135841 Transcript_62514/m.135841 type:complete len:92 (+) Transcript_62514:319-594(+)